ncbi:MAG: hypothetical protein V7L21_32095 [Nostoc sp.]|uniref:hypothetical protein n=1 Tax=unclassified Nostoc TaxID=2593658 RepID=UPI0025F07438|nr:hypothetical protein [Nostoc sp. NMS9]MBN3939913.1 hypothetical protein [Nostoc sp. NMS9]
MEIGSSRHCFCCSSDVQYYLAYFQARQAAKIATYRMQQLALLGAKTERIATVNSQGLSHLVNPDYVAAATEMLNTNARDRLALEELAACVGLSSQATIRLLEASNLNNE